MTTRYNVTAVRKALRKVHTSVLTNVSRDLLVHFCENLAHELPTQSAHKADNNLCNVGAWILAAAKRDDVAEVAAGLELLAQLLPQITYGCITAGTRFAFTLFLRHEDRLIYRKTKRGVESPAGDLLPHVPADTVVYPVAA